MSSEENSTMLIDKLFVGFPKVVLQQSKISDFVDRLNYFHTVMVLIGCAFLVSVKQYIFEPIQCWVPPQFTDSWEEYVENYCWVQNTYYLPVHVDIPNSLERRQEKELSYYQWVPFILGLQALLFYLPFGFWAVFSNLSGINLDIVVKMASECLTSDVRMREKNRKSLAHYLSCTLGLLKSDNGPYTKTSAIKRKLKPFYLTSMYLTSKVLYIVNAVSQFYLLNWLLETKDTLFGLKVLRNLMAGVEWEVSAIFPRVTLCDFTIRDIGDNRPYTVQCVLATNMLNEKIFLFFWFWLVFISIVNILSFLWWLYKLSLPSERVQFIMSLLSPQFPSSSPSSCHKEPRIRGTLVSKHLFPDGVFLLRLIMTNFGMVICADLVEHISKAFLHTPKIRQNGNLLTDSYKNEDQMFLEIDTMGKVSAGAPLNLNDTGFQEDPIPSVSNQLSHPKFLHPSQNRKLAQDPNVFVFDDEIENQPNEYEYKNHSLV